MDQPRNQVVQLTATAKPMRYRSSRHRYLCPTAVRCEFACFPPALKYTDVVIRRHLYPQTMFLRANASPKGGIEPSTLLDLES